MGVESDVWSEVREKVRESIGRDSYVTWIEPLTFLGVETGTARFGVPTTFFGNWVNRNYREVILKGMRNAGKPVDRLSFDLVRPAQPRRGQPGQSPTSDPESLPDQDRLGAPLNPRYRFEQFVVGKPNELAYAAARRVAESPDAQFNPLFLYGGSGLGKTHLMHAIAWMRREREPDKQVIYLSAEQFMYRFVRALRFRDTIGFKQLFRSVDVLMVDDVQFIGGKESTQEEFFHTFNALVDQGKQIVISGDRSPGEMESLEERIRSRLQSGLMVDLHPTTYELRLGILQSKLDSYQAEHGPIDIAPGVLEFLAHRITTNVRELEGALNRLTALFTLVGRRINLEMATENLADILRSCDRKVTIDEIIRKVAEHYNLRTNDLLSARRTRSLARPRQIGMYLAKQLTPKSLPEIARRFNKKDHTTVIYAVNRIDELRQTDSQLADDIELLRRMLEG